MTNKIIILIALFISTNFSYAQSTRNQKILASQPEQEGTWRMGNSGLFRYRYVVGDPMNVRFYELKNGLTVILSVNKEKPRIQTLIATKAGSKTDPRTNTGLAHYLEHMLFKGTDQYGSKDWAQEEKYLKMIDDLYEQYNSTKDEAKRKDIYHTIDSVSGVASKYAIANEYDKMMTMIGAQGTNAFTSFEQTVYVNDIPSNAIDKWLKVEAERFRKPIFRIFHTELEAVYEEKNRSLDDDNDKVFETLFANLFQNHNYGQQTTIGTIDHLKNPSLNEIRKYFYKNYVPNNMAVIMVGDINPDELIVKLDKAFSFMKPKEVPPYTFTPEAEITSPIEKTVYGPDAEYIDIAFRFPGAATKDAMMLNFMSSILSNGNAGLMDLNLVKKQKVLEASAGAYTLQDYSVLFLEGKAKEGQKLEEVKEEMLNQLEFLKNGKFDDELLISVINNYKKSLIQRRESNQGRAFAALDAFCSNIDWKDNVKELEEMSKITKQDVMDFCQKWLKNNYVAVYKRMGKDENVVKVDKPTITPVETNRDLQSNFVKEIATMPTADIAPIFLNFDKDIAKVKLKNVDVLSVENKTNSLYTLYYYLDIGKWHNKMLPIAVDYLQYLGTDKHSAEVISKMFYKTASDFGVNSGNEETYVFLNGLQENFSNDVKQFEYLLKNCIANESALRDMIAGIKKKREDEKKNKNAIRNGLRSYAQYGADNPFNYSFTNEELDNIRAQDLVNLLHDLLNYKHKILYFGPGTSTALVTALKGLHYVPETFIPTPAVKKFNYVTQNKNQVLFADYDMVQSELMWTRNSIQYDPSVVPQVNLFNEYFGGSMSGVVFQDIRESKALAYSAYANYTTPQKKEELFNMIGYVGCQADKMKESIAAMNNLLNTMPESTKMLDQAKRAIKSGISTNRITKTGILFNYLGAQKKGLNYDIRKNIYDNVSKLTFKDINGFYKNNISQKPYSLCVLASEKKVDFEELKRFGELTKLSLNEVFGY